MMFILIFWIIGGLSIPFMTRILVSNRYSLHTFGKGDCTLHHNVVPLGWSYSPVSLSPPSSPLSLPLSSVSLRQSGVIAERLPRFLLVCWRGVAAP